MRKNGLGIYKLVIPKADTWGSPDGDREGGKHAREYTAWSSVPTITSQIVLHTK